MTEKRQEKIDDYLLGRSADRATFERELETDQELAAGLADTRNAMDAVRLAQQAKMKARLQAMEAEMRSGKEERKEAVVRRLPVRRYLAIAAAVLLLLTAGWFLMNREQPATDLYALAEFEPYDNIFLSLTKGAAEEDAERAAYVAYEAGDMVLAAERLSALKQTTVNRFYLGQARLATKDFAAAAILFDALRQREDFQLARESEYYLALARLGLEDGAGAKSLLSDIAAEDGHPLRAEAERLLAKLPT